MCDITIHIQCVGKYSEVLPDRPEETELVVEEVVSQALLEIFDTVLVDAVTVLPSSSEREGENASSL